MMIIEKGERERGKRGFSFTYVGHQSITLQLIDSFVNIGVMLIHTNNVLITQHISMTISDQMLNLRL